MTPTYATPFRRPLLAGLAWDLIAAGVLLRGASASPPAAATRRDSPELRPCARLAAGTVSGPSSRTAPAQGVRSAGEKPSVRTFEPLPPVASWWRTPERYAGAIRCGVCLAVLPGHAGWCPALTPALGGARGPLRVAAGGQLTMEDDRA